MPKRTNEFQHLITLIERLVADADARVTESKELTDNITGKLREVDIVIERNDGVRDVVVGVECSGSSSRPATVEWVERMWGKHSSLPTDKLVLVSKSGFSDSAKKKAEWWHISTLTLDQAQDFDWESEVTRINELKIDSFLLPYVTEITITFEGDPSQKIRVDDLKLPQSTLYDPEGNSVGNPLDVVNRWLFDPAMLEKLSELAFTDAGTVIEFERKLKRGCYLRDGNGVDRSVTSLQVKAKCRREVSKVSLTSASYGKAQVSHGRGTSFARPIQVAFVQKHGGEPRVVIVVKRAAGNRLST